MFLTGIVEYSGEDKTWGVGWVITSGELASRLRDALDAPRDPPLRMWGRRDSAPARPNPDARFALNVVEAVNSDWSAIKRLSR